MKPYDFESKIKPLVSYGYAERYLNIQNCDTITPYELNRTEIKIREYMTRSWCLLW